MLCSARHATVLSESVCLVCRWNPVWGVCAQWSASLNPPPAHWSFWCSERGCCCGTSCGCAPLYWLIHRRWWSDLPPLLSANLTMTLELCVATQSCVYREYRRGLRTQPWGAPVLRVIGEEMLMPTLTTWRLPVRKSKIQLHRELFRPKSQEFHYKLKGHYGIKRWAVVNKQHSLICVPLVKMGKSSVQGEGNCIASGAVIAVGELQWVEWCW